MPVFNSEYSNNSGPSAGVSRWLLRSKLVLLLAVIPLILANTPSEHSRHSGDERSDRALHPDQSADPWSPAEIIRPDELVKQLSGEQKPVIFQTGVVHLYRMGHIPESKYAGPATSAEGLALLKKEVQAVPRTREIVFYCGCCPWKDCPNIRPTYRLLREMGFNKIKVLDIPTNFTQDWVMKGLPVEKGGA
jgi:thiosulfate/3-mercaptopyruvate sulfurtransferase